MRIPCRRYWLLRTMNRSLRRSDPHLAAMLAIFARLNAGEAITSMEQAASPGVRAWRALVRLTKLTARMAAVLVACSGRALRRVAAACAGIRQRLGRVARAALGTPAPARPPLRRSGPGLPAN